MKIAVLGGGGAMGGIFGGWLARAGEDVTLVDVSAAAVAKISADGLLIEERDGSATRVKLAATTEPGSVGVADLILNFVKCYHTQVAIEAAKPMIGPDTLLLSLQNGWGNAARISAIVGSHRVLAGLTYHGGTLVEPGHVRHPGLGITHIGELTNALTPRLQQIAACFQNAGFETAMSERILDEVWKKLALNCCTLPLSGLLGFLSHELVAFAEAEACMASILREVVAVAAAQGIAMDYDERWHAITSLLAKAVGGKASMLQDVEARRRTEIEVINGAVVAAGIAAGVPTPVNQTMVALISALQAKYLSAAEAVA